MPISDFSIVGDFDRQRFLQFDPSDCANWYIVENDQGKKKAAMYPVMGRRHISFLGLNRLVFSEEPRGEFKTINYSYYVIVNQIFRVDKFYNEVEITNGLLTTFNGDVFFDFLIAGTITYAVFVDGQNVYVYDENNAMFYVSTGPLTPANPKFVAAFGNRIVVSTDDSSQFQLSEINLAGGTAGTFDPTKIFDVGGQALFNQASGFIRQFGVLHNQLYIFTDFTTDIWANIPSVFTNIVTGTTSTFPWKTNTSYNWDFGIFDPTTLDVGFSIMTWLAQNSEGLIQVMSSSGQKPERISTRAVDILFQRNVRLGIIGNLSPFLSGNADGFMYQWENTIFYRLSAGQYTGTGILDVQTNANSIEYNFETKRWSRVIEKNGERNRIQKHIYFNNTHFVTVQNDGTVYEMSGQFYDNEIRNPLQDDPQAIDAYIREPFRYERVTPIIAQDDYGEFITDWVEIDFVWGDQSFFFSESPFPNAEFLIDEEPGDDGEPIYLTADPDINGNPVYLLSEVGDTPKIDSTYYNTLFKPHIELYWSDDGGVSFEPADVLEFSQLGVYQWRMRWYQLGPSRNRCYKLVCVSPAPIVVLGGIMNTRRSSGGGD